MEIIQAKSLSLPQYKRINCIKSLAFHPTLPYVTLSTRKTLYMFCLRTGARVASLLTESEVVFIKYHPVNKMMVVAHRNGSIACYEMPDHPVSLFRLRNFHVPASSVSGGGSSHKDSFFSNFVCSKTRDGVIYTTQYKSQVIRARDLYSGKKISEMNHKKIVTALDVCSSLGNDFVVAGYIDGNVRFFENGQVLRFNFDIIGEKVKGSHPVTAISILEEKSLNFSPTTGAYHIIAIGTQFGSVQLWFANLTTYHFYCAGKVSLGRWVTSVQFHPTLPILYALTDKGAVFPLWLVDALQKSNGDNISTLPIMNTFHIAVDDPDVKNNNGRSNAPSTVGGNSISAAAQLYKDSNYSSPSIRFEIDRNTMNLVFYGKSFQLLPFSSFSSNYQVSGSDLFPIFTFEDNLSPLLNLPVTQSYSTQFNQFLPPESEDGSILYKFPFSNIYYISTQPEKQNISLQMESLSERKSIEVHILNVIQNRNVYIVPIRASFSTDNQNFLVFFRNFFHDSNPTPSTSTSRDFISYKLPIQKSYSWRLIRAGESNSNVFLDGKDGFFINSQNLSEFLILSSDGMKIFRYEHSNLVSEHYIPTKSNSSNQSFGKQSNEYFETLINSQMSSVSISRIFSCPFNNANILYVDDASSSIGYLKLTRESAFTQFLPEMGRLQLRIDEKIIQISWQNVASSTQDSTYSNSQYLIGILTSERVIISNEKFDILSQHETYTLHNSFAKNTISHPYKNNFGSNTLKSSSYSYFSILWIGNMLLFNNDQAVYGLAAGRDFISYICTLDHKYSKLVAALPDRLIFVSKTNSGDKMLSRYVNMGDILFQGALQISLLNKTNEINDKIKNEIECEEDRLSIAKKIFQQSQIEIELLLRNISKRYDCRQIPEWTLKSLLEQGSANLSKSVLGTSVCEYQWQVKFKSSLGSLHFEEAKRILFEEFHSKYIDTTLIPTKSTFYLYFSELAKLALEYGQFKFSVECYNYIRNYWSLMGIFSELQLDIGLEYLVQNCKDDVDLYSLYVGCETLLGGKLIPQEKISFDNVLSQIENIPFRPISEEIFSVNQLQGTIYIGSSQISDKTNINELAQLEKLPFEMNLYNWLGLEDFTLKNFSDSYDESTQGWGSQQAFDFQKSESDPAPENDSYVAPATTTTDADAQEDDGSDKSGENTPVDQDAIRQKYLGGEESNSSNSDFSNSDDDNNDFKKRKNLLRSIQISETTVTAQEENIAPRASFTFAGAVTKPTANARRRRIGGLSEVPEDKSQEKSLPHPPSDPLTDPLTATECMIKASESLERKDYDKSIRYYGSAISKLVSDPQEILNKETILRCIEYLLYAKIANEIANLVKAKVHPNEAASVASGLKLISERMDLQHYFLVKNQCYKINITANNFAFAAIVIRSFINKAPEKFRGQLQQTIDNCEKQGNANVDTNLPTNDSEPLLYDWISLRPLPKGSHYSQCDYCEAITDQVNGETCSICRYGTFRGSV